MFLGKIELIKRANLSGKGNRFRLNTNEYYHSSLYSFFQLEQYFFLVYDHNEKYFRFRTNI